MDDFGKRQKLFQLKPWNRDVSDEDILADIKRVAQSLLPKQITERDYTKSGRVSSSTVERRFGSWNNALSKVGLQVRNYSIPKEKLFGNMEKVWITLGEQPTRPKMRKPLSSYHGSAYERRFGTWRKALEEFVNWVNEGTDEQLPSEVMSTTLIKRTSRQPNLRLRFKVMLRDDFRCRYCGRSPATQPGLVLNVDHIIPWSDGGETTLENLQTLCAECNLGKGNLSQSAEVQ